MLFSPNSALFSRVSISLVAIVKSLFFDLYFFPTNQIVLPYDQIDSHKLKHLALLNSMMMAWKPNLSKSDCEPVASEQVREETQDLLMDDEEATNCGADLELGHGI